MKEHELIQIKLRNICFELFIDQKKIVLNHHLLMNLANKLLSIFNQKFVAIYIHCKWENTYELKCVQPKENHPFQTYFTDDTAYDQKSNLSVVDTTQNHSQEMNLSLLTIPLDINNYKFGYVVFASKLNESSIEQNLVSIIKEELQHFFKIVLEYMEMRDKKKKMDFASSLSARLYSTVKKNEILIEFIRSLETLYPNFSYNLLLSQDYETDQSLPIKLLEFSDDITKRVSTQVFLTGEVQIENKLKKNYTYLYAPLKGKQGIYGVLQVISKKQINFPKLDIEFIEQLASITGSAIENATLYQSSNRLVEDLKLINETSHQLNSNLKLYEIIKIVRNKIISRSHSSQVGFIQKEDNGFNVLSGSTDYFHTEEGQLLASYFLNKDEAVFTGDFKGEIDIPYRALMAIPMQHAGHTYGTTIILHEEPYYFTFESYKIMQALIRHSTLAIINTILKEQLEQAVIRDYLTRLYSRNYLDDRINEHMQVGRKGTLILLDIDDFKKINDKYGHHIGDEVLIQVAEIIKNNIRDGDTAARWGGEELAVYLPEVGIEEGVFIAQRISRHVEQVSEPKVTLSAGVSSWINTRQDSVMELFIRSDRALYEAKGKGKNCVVKNF